MSDIYIDVDTAIAVPVNVLPLIDDTDFKTIEDSIVYNAAGMDLVWNFVTSAGVQTQTAVTPTTAGVHDWTNVTNGMYKIEIPLSAGTINNDAEGYGWFTGVITGVLPFRGPVMTFRAASLNDQLVDSADTDNHPSTQGQVNGIGAASGGTLPFQNEGDNVDAPLKSVTFVGVETSGTNTSVNFDDGVYHNIDDTGNAIDIVYQIDVGGGRTATEVVWKGYLQGGNDAITLQVYNGSTWDTLKTISGKSGSTNDTISEALFGSHTGSGADLGKVFVRLQCTAQSNPSLYTDQLYVSAVNIGQSVGYANGSIWIDTNNGVAGTEAFVNGVADNPTDSIADALTIKASVGIPDIHLFNGSSITLAANMENESLFGDHWTLALGGQACGGLYCEGASVSGIATSSGDEMHFEGCDFATATVEQAHWDKCGFTGTVTMNTTDDYDLHGCYSKGAAVPVFTKTPGQTINFETHDWAGDITISGLELGDVVELGGAFRTVTLNGADATVHIHGHYETCTNNLTGSPTLEVDGAIKYGDVADILVDTSTTIPASISGLNDISTAQVNTEVDTALTDYDGPTRTEATSDKDEIITQVNANETKIDTIDTNVDAILVDTGTTLPASIAALPTATEITADMDANSTQLAALIVDTGTDIPALIAALNDLSAAQVNAEVVDVIDTDTSVEVTQPPAATSSLRARIGWLFALARNKMTQTASTATLRNDDDNGSIATSTDSDDGTTATRGEWIP